MILFINACVRSSSRTRRMADVFLAGKKDVREVRPFEIDFPTVDEKFLGRRDELIEKGRFDDPMFVLARQFAEADEIVVAAPVWDLSFPASLKQYFEQVNVVGLVFRYGTDGIPESLCKAKKLTYITSAGGSYFPEEFGFGYVESLAKNFYGIDKVQLIKATGLDEDGKDAETILRNVCEEIKKRGD